MYNSFLFIAEYHSIKWILHILFIHPSSVNGHLGCFQILAIVSNAAVNTHVHVFVCTDIFISLGHLRNILPIIFFIIVMLVGIEVVSHLVLICIFLLTNDIGNLFRYLLIFLYIFILSVFFILKHMFSKVSERY